MKVIDDDKYYQIIKKLNIAHYSGEVPYYSNAPLRDVEKALLRTLKPGSKILDVGCGSGRFSVGIAKEEFDVTGIDITPKAILAARNRAKKTGLNNIKFVVGDMTNMPFKSNLFDYAICPRFSINAVATAAKRKMAVKEMLRIVKENGTVYIESFNSLYLGKGLIFFARNQIRYLIRHAKIFFSVIQNKKYDGLLPGDITYEANKVKGATEGYAHLPSFFELRNLIPNGKKYAFYSIPQMLGSSKIDIYKHFRYSIWLEIKK